MVWSWPDAPIRSSDDLCREVTVPVSVTVEVAGAAPQLGQRRLLGRLGDDHEVGDLAP